jgi:DNA-binding response OmpR family regulator
MECSMNPPSTARPPAASGKRLLVVDDDRELCGLLATFLAREGFECDCVHDGEEGLRAALSGQHQAIVLDVMLPGLSGFDVLRNIRERKQTPVLMLTARGEHVDRVVGLEMGADDYVPKPFDPRELVARIRAVLRRAESGPDRRADRDPIHAGDLELVPHTREAVYRGRRVGLTASEFGILQHLVRASGRIVSREELSRAVLLREYGPGARGIDMQVSKLRRKLDGGRRGDSVIRTVRSAGYLLAVRAIDTPA